MHHRGFAPIILLIVAAILAVGIAGYALFAAKKAANAPSVPAPQQAASSTNPAQTSSTTGASQTLGTASVPTSTNTAANSGLALVNQFSTSSGPYAGWQAYEASTKGFAILYPPQYEVSEDAYKVYIYNKVSSPFPGLVQIQYQSATKPSQTQLLLQYILAFETNRSLIGTAQFSVSTGTAMIANFPAEAAFMNGPNVDSAFYVFVSEGRVYSVLTTYLSYQNGHELGSSDVARALADRILNTFRPIPIRTEAL